MKAILAAIGTCLAVLAVAAMVLFILELRSNHDLRTTNEELQNDLHSARTELSLLAEEKQQNTTRMAALEKEMTAVKSQLADLQSAQSQAEEEPARPYRVRAFLGQNKLAGAWIIPHRVSSEEEDGGYTYEPVVWFDETAKESFVKHQTNVVDRPVVNSSVNNYYPRPYLYTYGYWPRRPAYPEQPLPPVDPEPPTQPQPPAQTSPSPYEPVDMGPSDINARLFAPPMSVVNTRPQALGKPATSPINARLFRP